MTHTYTNMDGSTKESFDKAIHLFATNDDLHNHNKHCLISLNHPIAQSVATRVSSNYSMEADEEKMDNELLIVVGARVMLTSNLWTNARLVNGALGVVEHIVYNPTTSPPEPPTYVLVRFDNYVGVPWDELFPHTIPIIPIERGNNRQIPLRLAWGLTIHKSQGLTLEKTTINIGKTEQQGLTFTTISRVKALHGLQFQPPFPYDQYEKMGKCVGVSKRKAKEDRLRSITM
jgi:ATP-dependent DNA helicase PIF1